MAILGLLSLLLLLWLQIKLLATANVTSNCDYSQLWLWLLATATTCTFDYFYGISKSMFNFKTSILKKTSFSYFDTLMKLWYWKKNCCWNGKCWKTQNFGNQKTTEIKKKIRKRSFSTENRTILNLRRAEINSYNNSHSKRPETTIKE